MAQVAASFVAWLASFAGVFTTRSSEIFAEICTAWVLCPGRRTVTRMVQVMGPLASGAHDAYHRFLRAGAWMVEDLWRLTTQGLVARLAPSGVLNLDLDDTLFHKTGRKIEGSGIFRDAVRSSGKSVVYAWGLNLVVLTLRIRPPWGGEPLGLPINLRLYRKGGPTHLELAEDMIRQVAGWLPNRQFRFCGDGAYASLAGRGLPRTQVTSRMRRDAALFELPPKRKRKGPGRPRNKGRRLLTPEKMAKQATKGWSMVKVDIRGRTEERLVWTRQVLWYAVRKKDPVLLVIVRDPAGKERDDFFFTTDVKAVPTIVVHDYAGRWSIEDTFRNVKQILGGEDPQTWKGEGPEKVAVIAFWLYSSVWSSFLQTRDAGSLWEPTPWYPQKRTPSFADAMAALRKPLWRERVFRRSASGPHFRKTISTLIEVLSLSA